MSAPTSILYREQPDAFIAAHRLAQAQIPPTRLRALLEHRTLTDLFATPWADFRRAPFELTEKQTDRLRLAADAPFPTEFGRTAERLGIRVLLRADPAYPESLLPFADIPPLLFVQGETDSLSGRMAAIVGSRRATRYGQEQSERFARLLCEAGVTIVSGGAAGVDTTAHRSALDAGGKTVVILGCGIDHVYPSSNRALFRRIAEGGGAIVSEYPIGTPPEPWRFPARNRIIAALSEVTVVIESPPDSGALITARCAAEYGKSVLAVPGAVDTGRSRGCHELIRDGALIADNPEDVLFALGLFGENAGTQRPEPRRSVKLATPEPEESSNATPAAAPPPTGPLSPEEERFLACLPSVPTHFDAILETAGLSPAQAGVAATLLEMKAQVRRLPGNLFARIA
ncbi:MAG: DNA-processing protein DprA [Capsulimonadales bacterium]|nr:DNA-processing protein DprA [Capsulimonadales bacterium]